MTTDADILADIERFCTEHQMPETTFGRRAASDPNIIAGLRSGREPRRATREKLRAFMAEFGAAQVAA